MTGTGIKIRDKRTDEVIVDGEFQYMIKLDESAWIVEDREKITLQLEKSTENIWTTIIKGDVEIDS